MLRIIFSFVFSVFFLSCSGTFTAHKPAGRFTREAAAAGGNAGETAVLPANFAVLDEIAETERSGGYIPGMGLSESTIREQSGDYAGAVIAAYKELLWAYAYGNGGGRENAPVSKEAIKGGLEKVREIYGAGGQAGAADVAEAVDGALCFTEGRYIEARWVLSGIFGDEDEPDSFPRWMMMVCGLEDGEVTRAEQAAYSAIRSRYELFPAYWYHGARAFSGALSPEYAERCVNLAPRGPYADECRKLLALYAGLPAKDGIALMTRSEIEGALITAMNEGSGESLGALMPLLALADNPYTLYTQGALRSLARESVFAAWLSGQKKNARGRLAERLRYITGN